MKLENKNTRKQPMAAEPTPSYSAVQKQPTAPTLSPKERLIKETLSVDEYFDELISLVHQDYANLWGKNDKFDSADLNAPIGAIGG